MEVTWTAEEQRTGDLVGLFPATARNDEYSNYEWNYISTAGGSAIFQAGSAPGEYEFRLIRDGTHLAVSNPITVSDSC